MNPTPSAVGRAFPSKADNAKPGCFQAVEVEHLDINASREAGLVEAARQQA